MTTLHKPSRADVPVKVCIAIGCEDPKPLDDFPGDQYRSDGRKSRCKKCTAKQKRESQRRGPRRRKAPRRTKPMPRPEWGWQDRAACRGEDLVLFFGAEGERKPEREIRERKAKWVCMGCPVRSECLDYAISRPEKDGVWGGLNEDERMAERRRRRRRKAKAA